MRGPNAAATTTSTTPFVRTTGSAMSRRHALGAPHARDACERGQRLGHDLIHVVVLVGAETTNEVHTGGLIGELLVLAIERRVFGTRDWIVGIAFRLRKFVDARRLRVLLS